MCDFTWNDPAINWKNMNVLSSKINEDEFAFQKYDFSEKRYLHLNILLQRFLIQYISGPINLYKL